MTEKTIWKFPFEVVDTVFIEMPVGAIPIQVGLDPLGQRCIWAIVNPNNRKANRQFRIVGTEGPMPKETDTIRWHHVGSFNERSFVWHVFSPVTIMN